MGCTLQEIAGIRAYVHTGAAPGRCSQYHAPGPVGDCHVSASSGWPDDSHFLAGIP